MSASAFLATAYHFLQTGIYFIVRSAAFQLVIGVTCLILELKMPGASLPGVIAAVCFVLFFWSQSQLHGQITWLAVLLFILGLVLIGVEVFVLPGTGVCGISGVLLMVGSLGLVAFGHWPQTTRGLDGLRPEARAVRHQHSRGGRCWRSWRCATCSTFRS